jgi:hypothetical protein
MPSLSSKEYFKKNISNTFGLSIKSGDIATKCIKRHKFIGTMNTSGLSLPSIFS